MVDEVEQSSPALRNRDFTNIESKVQKLEYPYLIVGAGGLGREVFQYASDLQKQNLKIQIAGFLDDNANALDGLEASLKILGPIRGHKPVAHYRYLFALGDPAIRYAVVKQFGPVAVAPPLVHPAAYVAASACLAGGVIVSPFCFIGPGATIASYCLLNVRSTVGHDSKLGSFATLSPNSVTGGFAEIGEGAFLATGAIVNPGKRLGDWSKISSGTVVGSDMPAGSLIACPRPQSRVMFKPPRD